MTHTHEWHSSSRANFLRKPAFHQEAYAIDAMWHGHKMAPSEICMWWKSPRAKPSLKPPTHSQSGSPDPGPYCPQAELLELWSFGKEDKVPGLPSWKVGIFFFFFNQHHVPRNLQSSRMQFTLRVARRQNLREGTLLQTESASALRAAVGRKGLVLIEVNSWEKNYFLKSILGND